MLVDSDSQFSCILLALMQLGTDVFKRETIFSVFHFVKSQKLIFVETTVPPTAARSESSVMKNGGACEFERETSVLRRTP